MPIIDLQRRIAEAGRIRIGAQTEAANGRTRPVKLEQFRLTSPDKLRIEQAAGLWGGKPQQWQAPAGPQWEVYTEASALDVILPPADLSFSQSYELWSAGGCQRRCDGVSESLSGGECLCDPESRACDIHTRLSLLLKDLPGLGVWRLDSSGYYAAVELQGAVQVIEIAAGRGTLLPARLLLVQRQVKRTGADGKPQTRKFAVPVLDIEVTPGQLLAPSTPGPLALTQGSSNDHDVDGSQPLSESYGARRELPPPPLTPVPASVQHRPSGSVAEQMKASTVPQERKRRANSAQPVPATGVEPRTAEQAYADNAKAEQGPIRQHLPPCPVCEEMGIPPGSHPSYSDPKVGDQHHGQYDPAHPEEVTRALAAEPDDRPGKVTPQQVRVLFAALTRHGFNAQKEPDTLLQIIETLAGRELTGPNKAVSGNPRTTKNLTRIEAELVIGKLDGCDSQAAVWELVGQLAGDKPPF